MRGHSGPTQEVRPNKEFLELASYNLQPTTYNPKYFFSNFLREGCKKNIESVSMLIPRGGGGSKGGMSMLTDSLFYFAPFPQKTIIKYVKNAGF